MEILRSALTMIERHPLCDHCLGRQFALLGHGVENDERGKALKLALTFKAHAMALSKGKEGARNLRILATNGFSDQAREILQRIDRNTRLKTRPETCFLCEGRFDGVDDLVGKALRLLEDYQYNSFLVGTELPTAVAEREDEFKAEFEVGYGENLRNEFGRVIGKKIAAINGKTVDFKKPEIVVLVNPFTGQANLQVNPLFIAGRYRKLLRGIPQSKWFCSNCRGKGCKKCNYTGKMYPESVQEIIEKPFLDATAGLSASFHASGREDIDARMLGNGRPFVVEITKPKKRFLDLEKMKGSVNAFGKGKVQVSSLKLADKDVVRRLKKGEGTQKEYRVLMEFENRIKAEDLGTLEKNLVNATIKQQTPTRVLHRRAN